ncbi:MAG TPA: invasion associated locus B family protein [Beijerinckiaceae bacterium]|nr:invasion associated locus B family protein [Beijerinckiaceae bacterium]
MIMRATSLAVFALLIPHLASARTAPAPAQQKLPHISAEPQQTSATFGNWVLRCTRIGHGALASQLCEVAEVLRAQGQQAPLAQVAIGRATGGAGARGKPAGLRLTLLLPVNLSFDQAPRLAMSADDAHPIELTWRRCIPSGCFADAAISNEIVARLRQRTKPMRILFKNASEQNVVLPLSPLGLPQALDAFTREATAK